MAPSLCGDSVRSRRSLLAVCWSIVNLLALLSFATAFIIALTAKNSNNNNYNNNNNNENDDEEQEQNEQEDEENNAIISVSSRAMAFSALWTMVLSGLLGVFGTILLGFQSPVNGKYFWCCPTKVHTTTPLSLGSFIGALLMFSNLTLVCSVLFGEFQVHDYQREGEQGNGKDEEYMQESALSRSSLAFSIMCLFLTIIYAGFAGLVFTYADDLLRENYIDSRQEALTPSDPENGRGYIDSDRFGVEGKSTHITSEGFVSPKHSRSCDTSGPL
mmetsp:Transcript_27528/g.32560  ORF Transcript_27528/g.32560 Transcript_27528/m.32560 type:complete len:273 (+) Transcript_27528:273-1091(+)